MLDERIITLLTLKGPMTTAEIANGLSYRSESIGTCLRRLIGNGDVFRNNNQYTVVYGGECHKILDKAFKPIFPMTAYFGR